MQTASQFRERRQIDPSDSNRECGRAVERSHDYPLSQRRYKISSTQEQAQRKQRLSILNTKYKVSSRTRNEAVVTKPMSEQVVIVPKAETVLPQKPFRAFKLMTDNRVTSMLLLIYRKYFSAWRSTYRAVKFHRLHSMERVVINWRTLCPLVTDASPLQPPVYSVRRNHELVLIPKPRIHGNYVPGSEMEQLSVSSVSMDNSLHPNTVLDSTKFDSTCDELGYLPTLQINTEDLLMSDSSSMSWLQVQWLEKEANRTPIKRALLLWKHWAQTVRSLQDISSDHAMRFLNMSVLFCIKIFIFFV